MSHVSSLNLYKIYLSNFFFNYLHKASFQWLINRSLMTALFPNCYPKILHEILINFFVGTGLTMTLMLIQKSIFIKIIKKLSKIYNHSSKSWIKNIIFSNTLYRNQKVYLWPTSKKHYNPRCSKIIHVEATTKPYIKYCLKYLITRSKENK